MVKGNIGAGILALPRAVSLAGLWVGCIGIAVLSLFCVTCMHLIVDCAHRLSAKAGRSYMSYADVAEFTFSTSPNKSLHKFAGFFRYLYLWEILVSIKGLIILVSIELCQSHNPMTINFLQEIYRCVSSLYPSRILLCVFCFHPTKHI